MIHLSWIWKAPVDNKTPFGGADDIAEFSAVLLEEVLVEEVLAESFDFEIRLVSSLS